MNFQLDFSKQFMKALNLMENTSHNVFITGKAGTGKSTLLSYFRNTTRKNVIVLAPTGVAAINVQGQTIHSFCRFKPDITLDKVKKLPDEQRTLYEKIDTVVIDEISMVRSDLLDCVDKFLRLNRGLRNTPFGGVQMIFIGDLYQLPPVVASSERDIFRTHYRSHYFFDAKVFERFQMEFLELEKIYRQNDQEFIDILNAIRNNSVTEEQLAIINDRLDPAFERPAKDFSIYLTTTNDLAAEINKRELEKLKGETYTYEGWTRGNFDMKSLPTEVNLQVKIGSQIMLLNNDSEGRWVNGTIGKIVGIEEDEEEEVAILIVELSDGRIEKIYPHTWELFQFSYNEKSRGLVSETVGTFTQYPLKLAWAVTIHKSQGKTFDKVIIDIGRGTFAHGQMYVALSRATSLEGIVLKKPIQKKHIFMDWRVVQFVTRYQYQLADAALPIDEKVKLIERVIASNGALEIVYLKANDVKSKRVIRPQMIGEMEYLGRNYLGVSAFDFQRQDHRSFRVDRILELKEIEYVD